MIVASISPANEALQYLDHRLGSDHYRGRHTSQHNRYDINRIQAVLEEFQRSVGSGKMIIRTKDLSGRPENLPEEAVYAEFCDRVKLRIGVGTQDAMRKNFFVDLHRMGLLRRFAADGTEVGPYAGTNIHYVRLSEQALKFLSEKSPLNRYFIYSKAIDLLLRGTVDTMISLLQLLDDRKISRFEYMLFVSAVDCGFAEIALTIEECVELIKKYRTLSRTQRSAVVAKLKNYAQPGTFAGNKIKQRDFGNWKNATDQQLNLLSQTVYFELLRDNLAIRIGSGSAFETSKRLDRSLAEKDKYFEQHKVERQAGFQLHHTVPLAWSESIEHFKILDKWENMLYMDAYKHALITANDSRNANLTFDGNDVLLDDSNGSEIKLKFNRNVKYSISLQELMRTYNVQLNSIKI